MTNEAEDAVWTASIADLIDSSIPSEEEVATAVEEVLYVDDALYKTLSLAASEDHRARTRPASDSELLREAQAFILHEALLLDTGAYEEWLNLFTPDCIYWVPANRDMLDPRNTCSINFDDHRRLADRIALIRTGYLHAQTPASRTVRFTSNVQAWSEPDGSLQVRSNTLIYEWRHHALSPFVTSQQYRLVPVPGSGWRIKWKIINLINCDEPLGNVTFIL